MKTVMTNRERFRAVFCFHTPDRLPRIEWAPWWDKTRYRWESEGMPQGLDALTSQRYFGLDPMLCIASDPVDASAPAARGHGLGLIDDEAGYDALRPMLYTDARISTLLDAARRLKPLHDSGEVVVRLWLDGFFWFPRRLLGIERHLYAFYDQAPLLHRISDDLAAYHIRVLERLFTVLVPDMVGFAEDMSYNLGPMLSEEMFDEFLCPRYRRVIPTIRDAGAFVLVDSDGDVTRMVPWLLRAGIQGVYPLERQAGVDVAVLRALYPRFLMLGAFDKMTMFRSPDAMREEFARLRPTALSGGFIPSVDHQTPPEVSLDMYRDYLRQFSAFSIL
ncbi:MAG: uroporphyrinogen decarboxylase family protein [Clostridiaceae bacterium]|nr:uroporphyrinogen decarboxylase family protein [Clostridiaceae bacterium]